MLNLISAQSGVNTTPSPSTNSHTLIKTFLAISLILVVAYSVVASSPGRGKSRGRRRLFSGDDRKFKNNRFSSQYYRSSLASDSDNSFVRVLNLALRKYEDLIINVISLFIFIGVTLLLGFLLRKFMSLENSVSASLRSTVEKYLNQFTEKLEKLRGEIKDLVSLEVEKVTKKVAEDVTEKIGVELEKVQTKVGEVQTKLEKQGVQLNDSVGELKTTTQKNSKGLLEVAESIGQLKAQVSSIKSEISQMKTAHNTNFKSIRENFKSIRERITDLGSKTEELLVRAKSQSEIVNDMVKAFKVTEERLSKI